MIPKEFIKNISPFGFRATITMVSASIRLYGWPATLSKIVRRLSVSNNFYRQYLQQLERLEIDTVDNGSLLFSTPRILVIGALDLPQCRKYRILQKVEHFESVGWACSYAHYLDEPRVISNLQISTALIIYRMPSIPLLDNYLYEAKRLGIKTYYDIDDPIFNQSVYSGNTNLKHLHPDERTHLLSNAVHYREAMTKVDALILSTNYLKTLAASEFDKPVFLWRNLADASTLSMVKECRNARDDNQTDTFVIGYASGSRAHDEDFSVVSKALCTILSLNEHVSLRVQGHVVIPSELQIFEDRIETQPFSGYLQYLHALSQTDISIVPLTKDRFNECKSAIRYIEASLCEVPTIASPVGQFSEIIEDGKDGFLAKSTEEWVSKLTTLVDDRKMRRAMGIKSRDNVMMQHTITGEGAIDRETLDQFLVSNE